MGQSTLALEPLKPLAPPIQMQGTENFGAVKSLTPPPQRETEFNAPNSNSTSLIELKAIPKFSNAVVARVSSSDAPKDPIAVSPLKPVTSGNQPKSLAGPLSVENMIGPAADPSMLFLRSNTNRNFLEAAEQLPTMRRQLGMYGEFEWSPAGYCWQSPAFCYSPLYFEQPNLERYGQGKGKPFASTVSAAYFVGQATFLPVAMFVSPPWCKDCTLGHHRPGNCAPFQRKPEHRQ
ncbi:MAG: hypothetical protein ABL921_06755 [Pirellula sp.]